MKVRYNLSKCQIEVDAQSAKDCFSQLAGAVEIFAEEQCGSCGSDRVVPVVREVQGNTYYELRCQACGATLGFGQRKADGQLYPRRKDKGGEYLDNYGWVKWQQKRQLESDVAF